MSQSKKVGPIEFQCLALHDVDDVIVIMGNF